MQQDTFFYPVPPNYSQEDTRLQFQNVNSFHMQPNMTPWPSNCIPDNVGAQLSTFSNIDKSAMNCMGHPPANNIATPVSTAMYGTTATFSWAHTVPTFMPWVPKGEGNVSEPLVRFTAPFPPDPCTSQTATSWELFNNLGANKTNVNMHLKRKSDIDIIDTAPQKLCVTEERMAARMKELHISNQYSVPSENFAPYGETSSSSPSEKSITNLQQLEAMLKDSECGCSNSKSLVLAPEIKKLVEPEKLFASAFLNKVERPSMAVVVWQPQRNVVNGISATSNSSQTKEEEISNDVSLPSEANNNNNSVPQRLSAICNQHISFGSHVDQLINPVTIELDNSADVTMDI